jgi:hypothetical protein
MPEQTRPLWLQRVISRANELSESFQLDDEQARTLREYVVWVARDNYIEGNSAGIHWARTGKNRPSVE